RIPVGSGRRGPITERIQKRYFEIVLGQVEDQFNWLTIVTPVGEPVEA
ncbi:MAG: branched chain amino acid aminotransferase, partial [Acidobacteriaceae bacterium]|nr:branched chain amino acid aminotransferase [Acidobacteriaceae bacterium]